MAYIALQDVTKVYKTGEIEIHAADGISFEMEKGEFVVIVGPSGAGKTTVLNILGGMDSATSGTVFVDGEDVAKYNAKRLTRYRREDVGFVFQFYNLVPNLTALENVELPLVFKRVPKKKRRAMAKEMLEKVGLKNRLKHKPKEMSGGQQQRVGIARAFVAKPSIVFADEPTGNLDTKTTMEVMELIREIAHDNHQTIVMVTHDRGLAQYADRVIHILDGKVQTIDVVNHNMEDDEPEITETKKEETNVEEENDGTVGSVDDDNSAN